MTLRRIPIAVFVFLACVLAALAALAAITLFAFGAFRQAYYDSMVDDLSARAKLAAPLAAPYLESGDYASLQALCRTITEGLDMRVTVILPDGRVVADSVRDPASMENHGDREELRLALNSGKGQASRLSETLGTGMFYYALPVHIGDTVAGVVRVSLYKDRLRAIPPLVYSRLLIGAGVAALVGLFTSAAVSRVLRRPMERLVSGMGRFAGGDFTAPIETPVLSEMALLSESLNKMAARIDERLRAVTKERNQQEAVLSSMVEGVLAVDNQGRVMTFNAAAARLTGIDFARSPGACLGDIAPDQPITGFVSQILENGTAAESEFGDVGRGDRILRAHGSVLRDAQGKGIGAVVVLNDVTRLRRLEQVRRDFVANVSHELRTPITSIKGFVETLLDGALNDQKDATRFLEILAKQADRLNAILGDLLTLSRIEEGEEKASISLEHRAIRDILKASMELCSKKASDKNIAVYLDCPQGLTGHINPSLLEQAVANLIDNAVKYSPAGSSVQVRALRQNGVVIRVEDHGCGVAPEHLPRLFERFYRVDKARSRSLGGTGLGLAIVKHVITAHGGRVTVESAPGVGSTFSIFLPDVDDP